MKDTITLLSSAAACGLILYSFYQLSLILLAATVALHLVWLMGERLAARRVRG